MNNYITELTTFGGFKLTPINHIKCIAELLAYKLFNIQNIYSCMQIVFK